MPPLPLSLWERHIPRLTEALTKQRQLSATYLTAVGREIEGEGYYLASPGSELLRKGNRNHNESTKLQSSGDRR